MVLSRTRAPTPTSVTNGHLEVINSPPRFASGTKDIAVVDGNIAYEDSLRQFALKLDVISIDRQNPAHVRSRARDQAKRARNFDSLVQKAYRQGQPARIILLLGEDKGIDQLGWDTSRVNYLLDTGALVRSLLFRRG